jgi:serine/threonine-protein kinase
MYNTYRIAMVCEYMESRTNLEYMFRKRKQQNVFWKQEELEKMIVSIISTLSYLQSVGICHRDLKPANLFLLPNSFEMKIIDFGESKDHYREADDGGVGTMATIRGTPQYLSPILWKAHVEDGGNSRHANHNIFKSDVFSCGLIFFQCASMDDVTGFNQKNQVNDGEKLVESGLKKLKQRYSDHIIEIIRLMLKFEETDRPSFVELAKLVLTSTENSLESPKDGKGKLPKGVVKSSNTNAPRGMPGVDKKV